MEKNCTHFDCLDSAGGEIPSQHSDCSPSMQSPAGSSLFRFTVEFHAPHMQRATHIALDMLENLPVGTQYEIKRISEPEPFTCPECGSHKIKDKLFYDKCADCGWRIP